MDATYKPDNPNLPIATQEIPLAVKLAQAELDQAVSTAKAYPRSIALAMRNIVSLVSLDAVSAAECVYALPRAGKPIRGPSVRLAEIIASQWGNCHIGSRVVAVDRFEKVVIAEGVFYDLETGMKRVAQVQRRISDKNGKLFNDDMIAVTGNAACSVAIREAILKGVPKAVWRQAYDVAEAVIAGDVKTVVERRAKMVTAFHAWGVTVEQLCACVEVAGIEDIQLDELATLLTIYNAIKAGEAKLEDYFTMSADKAKAEEGTRQAARARADAAAKPKTEAKPKEEPKPEPEKKTEEKPPVARRETAPEPETVKDPEPAGEAEASTETADDVAGTTEGAESEATDEAGDTGKEQPEPGADEPDLLSVPFAKTVIEDAEGFGEEAARATHREQLETISASDPQLYAALDAELTRIGG